MRSDVAKLLEKEIIGSPYQNIKIYLNIYLNILKSDLDIVISHE